MIDLREAFPALWTMHGGNGNGANTKAERSGLPWAEIIEAAPDGRPRQDLADLRDLIEQHPEITLGVDSSGHVEVKADTDWRWNHKQEWLKAQLLVYDFGPETMERYVLPQVLKNRGV